MYAATRLQNWSFFGGGFSFDSKGKPQVRSLSRSLQNCSFLGGRLHCRVLNSCKSGGAVGSGGEWRRPATPKPQEAQLTTPLSTSRSQSESPDSEPRRQRDLRVRRPLSEGAPGLWRVLVELHACGVRFCHSVRGLAQAFACCGAGFGRGVVPSIRRAQRCTPFRTCTRVRGVPRIPMHAHMYSGHSSAHATRSARAWRGACMHR